MKIKLTSVSIDDYDKALKFYTEFMGFLPKRDIPLGGGARWITVVSPDEPDGTELLLEPNADYPAMKALKESLVNDGMPFTAFEVNDVQKEYERMKGSSTSNRVRYRSRLSARWSMRAESMCPRNSEARDR
jgi:catechol 2,3-dioxygenase-like lactoylglutathione lyase family enzyme